MTNAMNSLSLRRSKGLSLIEVLVGMVIGLIGIVVIMQVYLANENFKRTTAGAGSAQINGSISLYSIQRDMLTAGYGIADSRALACGNLKYFYSGTYSAPPGAASGALRAVRVAPVVITDGGTNPDTITVMYADSSARVVPANVSVGMALPGSNVRVDNAAGFSSTPGDLILVAMPADCTLMQVTNVASATLELTHASTSALWNPNAGGSFTTYAAGATVFNLGKPTVNVYSINANKLQQLRVFSSTASNVVPTYNTAATTLADDIVDLKAQYGKDSGSDGIVDTYDKTLPADATAWKKVLSVRVAVLARSQNEEKRDGSGNCTATTAAPTWSGGTFTLAEGVPSCYKYKVLETVIPLRNMIWSRL
jgi:type IV pilus assembly protein PilW